MARNSEIARLPSRKARFAPNPAWVRFASLSAGLILLQRAYAQNPSETNPWHNIDAPPSRQVVAGNRVRPEVFRAFSLNQTVLQSLLDRAPKEHAVPVRDSPAIITLPSPDGTLGRFRFVESPVMAPELAAKFPEIKTYLGQGMDDPGAVVRFDLTPDGFHAQVLSPRGAVYIDPYLKGSRDICACYYKRDYRRIKDDFRCLARAKHGAGARPAAVRPPPVPEGILRTYRLACAATGEYTQFHGGTVSAGLAAIVTAINRVTGIYEAEAGIRLELVANNDLIVYTDGSADPYDNNNPLSLLAQNQSNLDAVIGSANYDIGHVFSTAGGGLAEVGVVCADGGKAEGETGTATPIGDAFYVDYVAHEIGHQFGANHTFNSDTGYCAADRNGATAYEPGSGSTIMSYAGICGADNLQPHSDPYFHSASLEEIIHYITSSSGGGCATLSVTGNRAPSVNAGPGFTIPAGTPFTLTAAGSDRDGDALTYCWEERDLGPAAALADPDNGSSPLFRSFSPTPNPARTFPQLPDLLHQTAMSGEMLPAIERVMQFCVTARDNRPGGIKMAGMQVTVTTNSGPFAVTCPNAAVTWSNVQMVAWSVAGTTNLQVGARSVNILLSTNGGLSFPILLAPNVPNTGRQTVLLPAISNTTCRIKVEAVGNIFFAISDTDFTIVPGTIAVSTQSFTNAKEIIIRDGGTARPYPSTIEVHGITGAVTRATVTLRGITHSWSADIDMLLVGPDGRSVMLMADAGGGFPLRNATLTFDDCAAKHLPHSRAIASGTYRPTSFNAGRNILPSPAPRRPYGKTLSVFDGSDPNGPWSLFVRDDAARDCGRIAAGWTLTITSSNTVGNVADVVSPPVFESISVSNDAVVLAWSAIAGRKYRIEYKASLSETNWTALGPDVTAAGARAEAIDSAGSVYRRFYRIVLVQ